MYESLFIIGMVFAFIAAVFLVATVVMFFRFNIPELRREVSGAYEKQQIEEIRKNNLIASNRRNGVNVFEELEKRAKVKKNNTHSLNIESTTEFMKTKSNETGTSVLADHSKTVNPGFIIEKNIMYVSTNEVLQ